MGHDTDYDPTPEQQAAIDAFCGRGENLVLEAGAGTGKTSTLKFLSRNVPDDVSSGYARPRTGIYMAYNASIAKEADRDFPANTLCKTGHAHTMSGAPRWQFDRLNLPRIPPWTLATVLRTQHTRITDDVKLTDRQIASVTMATIERFARSAREQITTADVPDMPRLPYGTDGHRVLAAVVRPIASRVWEQEILTERSDLPWTFDYFRKVFQLEKKRLPGSFLFLDEAQDCNGVTIAIVQHQQTFGTRVVAVGDECQAINGWMGAVDAMSKFGGSRLQLSKSFRFGPAIAEEANKFLGLLDARIRITGHEPVGSTVGPIGGVPTAILTRKNATAVAEAMTLSERGTRVALVKTVAQDIVKLAKAAQALKDGRPTDHQDLMAFESWGQVQDYVDNDHGGADLKVFVDLIDSHTPEKLIDVVGKFPLPTDRGVECVVSTAHRSKGLEWDSVRIAEDFALPLAQGGEEAEPSRDDLMLAYVAVTRAKKNLDVGGLRWINDLTGTPAPPVAPAGDLVDPWNTPTAATDPHAYVVIKSAVADSMRAVGLSPDGRHLRDVS